MDKDFVRVGTSVNWNMCGQRTGRVRGSVREKDEDILRPRAAHRHPDAKAHSRINGLRGSTDWHLEMRSSPMGNHSTVDVLCYIDIPCCPLCGGSCCEALH